MTNTLKNTNNIHYTANYKKVMKEILFDKRQLIGRTKNGSPILTAGKDILPLVKKAKWSYLRAYSVVEIQDFLMEALMNTAERCSRDTEFDENFSVSSVTYEMRTLAKRAKRREMGLNLDGSVPKAGRNLHIQNYYDKDGNNMIDRMGYDENGDLVMENRGNYEC